MTILTRRSFIQTTAALSAGAAMLPVYGAVNKIVKKKVKIGIIGAGGRGTSHLRNFLKRSDVLIPAICDINPRRIDIAQALMQEFGHKKAKIYTGHDLIYQKMLQEETLDGVLIATPWVWHTPMSIDAMESGVMPGMETDGAASVEECWALVRTRENTGVPMMFMENVCYRRDVMAVLNMVRQGILGELIHCQCGYQHDLRQVKFSPGTIFGAGAEGEAVWRTQHSVKRNGDLYPTHGIGPIAMMLNINRGNQFISLTSTASKARGLQNYIKQAGGESQSSPKADFRLGDVITTVIKCANGESVVITHDTNLPRPYSLGFRVQGTRGLWMKDGDQIYIEGLSPAHTYEDSQPYLNQYDHALWKRYSSQADGAGHGGMDFYVDNAFVETLKRQCEPPIDVYDAAAWRVITVLSERSIAEGGEPQAFPDFTHGRWIHRKDDFAMGDIY